MLLDSVSPSCQTLGYDRYLCTECGKIEKRDYAAALGHSWQGVVVREATCEADGKLLNLCARCGQMEVTATPKGEHVYHAYPVAATCTHSGYTVRECEVCGDRHIEDITPALAHSYESHTTPATCEAGGHTSHLHRAPALYQVRGRYREGAGPRLPGGSDRCHLHGDGLFRVYLLPLRGQL